MNKKAFTLIELIVAITVFVIGIVSMFPLISHGINMSADSRSRIMVGSLARGKLQEIEAEGFNNTFTSITTKTSFPDDAAYKYTLEWTPLLSDIANASEGVLYEAKLTVYWQGRSGEKKDIFITYISRMKPY